MDSLFKCAPLQPTPCKVRPGMLYCKGKKLCGEAGDCDARPEDDGICRKLLEVARISAKSGGTQK